MGLLDKLSTGGKTATKALQPALDPGEELLGTLMVTRSSGMVPQLMAVGVTPERLILAPIGKKDKGPMAFSRADITGKSASGPGANIDKIGGSTAAKVTLETRTHGPVSFTVADDDLVLRMARGGGTSKGILALREFLASVP